MHIEDIRKLKDWVEAETGEVPDNKWIGQTAGKFDESPTNNVFVEYEVTKLTLTKKGGRLDKVAKGHNITLIDDTQVVLNMEKLKEIMDMIEKNNKGKTTLPPVDYYSSISKTVDKKDAQWLYKWETLTKKLAKKIDEEEKIKPIEYDAKLPFEPIKKVTWIDDFKD